MFINLMYLIKKIIISNLELDRCFDKQWAIHAPANYRVLVIILCCDLDNVTDSKSMKFNVIFLSFYHYNACLNWKLMSLERNGGNDKISNQFMNYRRCLFSANGRQYCLKLTVHCSNDT